MFKSNIIIVLIILVTVVSGIYFWRNKTISNIFATILDKTSSEKYINEQLRFSIEIPKDYLVQETDDYLYVVKKPTLYNETPSPDIRINIEQGSKTTIDSSDDLNVLRQIEVSIHNIPGHKTVVSYGSLPKGNECPIYRLRNNGTVYEFSPYECLESSIFEPVVKSFRVIQ